MFALVRQLWDHGFSGSDKRPRPERCGQTRFIARRGRDAGTGRRRGGATPFDWGQLRLWLPAVWTPPYNAERCHSVGFNADTPTRLGVGLARCDYPHTEGDALAITRRAGPPRPGGRSAVDVPHCLVDVPGRLQPLHRLLRRSEDPSACETATTLGQASQHRVRLGQGRTAQRDLPAGPPADHGRVGSMGLYQQRYSDAGIDCQAAAHRRPASRRPKTVSSSILVSPVATRTPPSRDHLGGATRRDQLESCAVA
jgi:hypothetical protein